MFRLAAYAPYMPSSVVLAVAPQAWYTTHLTAWLPWLDRRRAGYTAVRGTVEGGGGVYARVGRGEGRKGWQCSDEDDVYGERGGGWQGGWCSTAERFT